MKKLILSALLLTSITATAQNTIPTNGNVGIGTMNPSAKLDVNGHAIVDSTLTVKDSVRFKNKLTVDEKVVFKKNAVVKGQLFRAENNARIQNNLRVNNNTRIDNILRVDGLTNLQGNVKMPNISPLNNVSNDFTFLIKKPNGQLKTVTKDVLAQAIYADKYIDCFNTTVVNNPTWSNGQNKIYTDICNLVNVGIGTSTPAYKLDVIGTIYGKKLKIGSRNATETASINVFNITNSTDIVNFGIKNNFTSQQSLNLFTINNNGTVQINTRNNAKALLVYNTAGTKILQLNDNGLLRAREIKVDLEAWPDYVFDYNYKLMTLTDVEQYIKLYNHLPNVPTAKTIETEGLGLGKMQTVQMEKIEELTLYTIEQDKQIENLENTVEDLQKQLNEIKALLK